MEQKSDFKVAISEFYRSAYQLRIVVESGMVVP
jgi:hypothetical protein